MRADVNRSKETHYNVYVDGRFVSGWDALKQARKEPEELAKIIKGLLS